MTRRRTFIEGLDPFDSTDDMDGFAGFLVESDSREDGEDSWYRSFAGDHPLCELGLGDGDGLCVRDLWGCHIVGCEHADIIED